MLGLYGQVRRRSAQKSRGEIALDGRMRQVSDVQRRSASCRAGGRRRFCAASHKLCLCGLGRRIVPPVDRCLRQANLRERKSKRGFGCVVREMIAWIVPGSPTAPDCLPQTLRGPCRKKPTVSYPGHYLSRTDTLCATVTHLNEMYSSIRSLR